MTRMTRKMFLVAALLIPVGYAGSAAAVEEDGRSESSDEQPSKQEAREREGGEPIGPKAMRRGRGEGVEREGMEEGLPEAKIESFDRRERMVVRPRWRLGVYAYNTETGVVITRVVPGSPAWRVGFEPGDRIVSVDGYQVGFVGDRVYYLGEELQRRAGRRGDVLLLVQNVRNDRLLNIDVRLESRRHREPPLPFPRGRLEGGRPER